MNIKIQTLTILITLVILSSCVNNKKNLNITTKKQTSLKLYVTAIQAHKIITSDENILFVDVRTRPEVAFLGMPDGVHVNIPYIIVGDWDEWDPTQNNFKLYPNSNFLPYFDDYINANNYTKDSKIVIICRSGSRSAKAVNLLAQVGYTNVYTVVDGFEGYNGKVNGWKNSGLPWGKKLDLTKMYIED